MEKFKYVYKKTTEIASTASASAAAASYSFDGKQKPKKEINGIMILLRQQFLCGVRT